MGYGRDLVKILLSVPLAAGVYGCGKLFNSNSVGPAQASRYALQEIPDFRTNEEAMNFFLGPRDYPGLSKPATKEETTQPLARDLSGILVIPNVTNMHNRAAKITSPLVQVVAAENVGFDIGRYSLKIDSPGYHQRETRIYADARVPVLVVNEDLVPINRDEDALFNEAVRFRGSTKRWKYPPIIEVSQSEELTRGGKVTPALLAQVTGFFPKGLESQFGYYAKNAKVEVVPDGSWEPLNPGQTTKWPARPKKGRIIVQANNYIPGAGEGGFFDEDGDGWIDRAVISYRTASVQLPLILWRQEGGTAFLFEGFPRSLAPKASAYNQGSDANDDFTLIDTNGAHRGYNRTGRNFAPDRDDGWELTFKKNESGLLVPYEQRLLLDGIEYRLINLPGDFPATLNNVVDFDDFFGFATAFNTTNKDYDLNNNGFVDFDDFFIFADNFGRYRPTPVATKPIFDTRVRRIAEIVDGVTKMKALREVASQDPREQMQEFVKKLSRSSRK